MKTKTRSTPSRCGRSAVLLMLTLTMLLNASQAMTLCVRGHGDVALELLVDGHCTCEMETADTDASGSVAQVTSHGSNEGGWPCLDIPIPTSSCDRRVSLAANAQPPCLSGAGSPELATVNPPWAVSSDSRIFPAPHAPLETILLQV